ncbi:MAG: hypothetical protein FWD53_11360 [Phycisphaerales bacterium]|nr:hypothetical protein [Phycisphaerales bacterium]
MFQINRFWRFFRFGLWGIVFIALALYLFGSTDWAKLFGRLPTYADWIEEGTPIVEAVYQFKAERGLWPEYLDEMVPGFLSAEEFKRAEEQGWHYELVLQDGRPGLSRPIKEMRRAHVGFDFDINKPSWIVFGDIAKKDRRVLKVTTPPVMKALPRDVLVNNMLVELDRRIRRSSGQIVMGYRREKISLLLAEGRDAEARGQLVEARRSNEYHFWPRLAEVKLDGEASLAEFVAWVQANPSFTHWYYLSVAYRWAGRDAEALAAIEEASKLPAVVSKEDFDKTAFFLWDMGRFALRHEKWDLVLRLTEAWGQLPFDSRRLENSYLALSAAAKLATGDVAGAKVDMRSLRDDKLATWAGNLDALEAAIKKGDRTFRYDPGDKKEFRLFVLPE